MKFKAIIFDFDGVLVDSEKIHFRACEQILASENITLTQSEYYQHYIGLSDTEMFGLILQNRRLKYTPEQINMLTQAKLNAYKAIINSTDSLPTFPYAKPFIELYAKSMGKLAICSGSTREEVITTLAKLEQGGLRAYFEPIITIDDFKVGKPSPQGYLMTAERLNILPKDCLAIEDTPKGATAAKSAGMTVIALTTTHAKSAFDKVDFIAEGYQEIAAWLEHV